MLAIREGDLVRVGWGEGCELAGSVIHVSGTWIVFRPDQARVDEVPLSQDRLTIHSAHDPEQSCTAGLWRAWKDSDYTLQLQSEALLEQRRSYFRAPIQLSLALSRDAGLRIFMIEDLSGGGCRCRVEPRDEFVEGTEYTGFLNLDDNDPPLRLNLTVVRVEPSAVAFYFAVIPEDERQRILQTLFREYRAKRAASQIVSELD